MSPKTTYATQKTPVRELTPFELQEIFSFTQMNRKYKAGQITRDELTTYRFSLSIPVQDIILRSSKITFELLD